MSRIGKKPIPIPKGVTVKIEGNTVAVQGPKAISTLRCRQVLRSSRKTVTFSPSARTTRKPLCMDWRAHW